MAKHFFGGGLLAEKIRYYHIFMLALYLGIYGIAPETEMLIVKPYVLPSIFTEDGNKGQFARDGKICTRVNIVENTAVLTLLYKMSHIINFLEFNAKKYIFQN